MAGRLLLCRSIADRATLADRHVALRRFVQSVNPGSGSVFGDLTKGGRPASFGERVLLSGRQRNGAKARFNLGNVLHDRGELQAALILYRDAAALAPDFADAHFNLALLSEQLGLVDEARRHWRRYLELDPAGEWAAIAREHLGGRGRNS